LESLGKFNFYFTALLFRLKFSVIRISRDFIKMFSFPMIVAVGEVARVTEELAIIDHQTRDMASQNYQIFVQSAQTANLIKKSVSLFSTKRLGCSDGNDGIEYNFVSYQKRSRVWKPYHRKHFRESKPRQRPF
jgi:hypothetical protein